MWLSYLYRDISQWELWITSRLSKQTKQELTKMLNSCNKIDDLVVSNVCIYGSQPVLVTLNTTSLCNLIFSKICQQDIKGSSINQSNKYTLSLRKRQTLLLFYYSNNLRSNVHVCWFFLYIYKGFPLQVLILTHLHYPLLDSYSLSLGTSPPREVFINPCFL